MKRNKPRFHSLPTQAALRLLAYACLAATFTGYGATQSWNPNENGTGGNGTWDAGVTPDWDSGVVWTNSNDALFSGTGGTVAVVAPTANSVTFSATGPYLLTSGTLTLSGSDVTVSSNATVASAIASEGSLSVTGTGLLTLTGGSNLGGSLLIGSPGTVQIANGGVVSDTGGAVSGTATVSGIGSQWTSTGALNIGSSGIATLAINTGAVVSDSNGYIGNAAGSSGTVTVSGFGSAWTTTENAEIGGLGRGTLSVTAGGEVSNDNAYIGLNMGSNGAATVSGLGSLWTTIGNLYIGYSGTGALAITGRGAVSDEGRGTIGANAAGNGSVTVSGLGSEWTNGLGLIIGGSGAGTLTITGGGFVSSQAPSFIGNSSGGNGSVTISGSGSQWTYAQGLIIGGAGTGELTVTGGGTLSAEGESYIEKNGAATISGAGSTWTIAGPIDAQNGPLTITGGGVVSDGQGFIDTGANGSNTGVTVSGSGSTWTNSSDITMGQSASLTITDGGAVSNHGTANLGGLATVSGTGSVWTMAGNLIIGISKVSGTLAIVDGGVINDLEDVSLSNLYSGGSGEITVSGSGSALYTKDLISDNSSASSTISITGGGLISDSQTQLAEYGTACTVTVSGTGSRWVTSGGMNLGQQGNVTLMISDGGAVSGSACTLGQLATGSVTATVTGSGSRWTTSTSLVIGSGGADAMVTATDGGMVIVGGTTTIYNTGVLQLDANSIFQSQALTVNAGIVRTLGALTFDQAIFLGTGGINVDTYGFNSTFSGVLTGGGTLHKLGAGILALSASNNYTGGTVVTAGEVQLGNNYGLGAATGSLALNEQSLDLDGYSATVGALSGGGAALITTLASGTSTFTISGTANNLYEGRLEAGSGVLNLIDVGGGTLTLIGGSNLGGNLVSGSLGAVVISDGGVVSDSTGIAGYGGSVTVSGSGSQWTNASTLEIGVSGAGTLTINGGGSVSDGGDSYIGFMSESGGIVTVSGPGSTWNARVLLVGYDGGSGTLGVIGGGLVSDVNAYLGYVSTGMVSVSGTGSQWVNTNNLNIGVSGTGTLSISDGGAVSDAYGYLGDGVRSAGVATISGTGSKWTNTKSLDIGVTGAGTLILTNGGLASVTGSTTIGSAGTVEFDASSTFNAGSLAINGGTLVTLGATTFTPSAALGTGGMNINTNGFNSTFSGNFSGTGGLAKSGSGALAIIGASTYSGPTSVNAGALEVTTGGLHTATLGNTAIAVAAGAMFAPRLGAVPFSKMVNAGVLGSGTAGATLTLEPGSTLSMAGSAILTFNLRQEASFSGPAFTIGGASGAAPGLVFDIGNAATGPDSIDVTSTVTVLATGGRITIQALAGDTSLTPGSYDLITSAGGFSGSGGNHLTLADTTLVVDGTTYDLSLANSTADDEVLTVSAAAAPEVENRAVAYRAESPAARADTPLVGTAAVPEPGTGMSLLVSGFALAAAWRFGRRAGRARRVGWE